MSLPRIAVQVTGPARQRDGQWWADLEATWDGKEGRFVVACEYDGMPNTMLMQSERTWWQKVLGIGGR